MRLYAILFCCLTTVAVAQTTTNRQTPTMSLTPGSTKPLLPMVSVGPIMNSGTVYYDPMDRRFYNPQRAEPDFSNLKPPPMGFHYEQQGRQIFIVRN